MKGSYARPARGADMELGDEEHDGAGEGQTAALEEGQVASALVDGTWQCLRRRGNLQAERQLQ